MMHATTLPTLLLALLLLLPATTLTRALALPATVSPDGMTWTRSGSLAQHGEGTGEESSAEFASSIPAIAAVDEQVSKEGVERRGSRINARTSTGASGLTARNETSGKPDGDEKAGVYLCTDILWGGPCTHLLVPLGGAPESCTVLDATMPASSVGPDAGFRCIFYTNAFCTPLASDASDYLALSFPGEENLLVTDKGDFNDRLLSFHCFREEGEGPGLGVPPNVVSPEDGEGEGED